MNRPQMPPSRLISETGKQWLPRYGRYWSPSDWKLMRESGLMAVATEDPAEIVEEALSRIRQMREHWGTVGMAIGWVAGLAFMWWLQ